MTPLISRADFLTEILGSSWDQAGYPWFVDVIYAEGYDWDLVPFDGNKKFVTVVLIQPDLDPDDVYVTADNMTRHLSGNELIKAAETLGYFDQAKANDTGLYPFDIDADIGDQIIQQAVYGKVIFG